MRRTVVALAVALCALLIGAPATGQPSPVNYWGQFEGGTGQVSTPTGVAFPGTVVQVASGGADQYILGTDGGVYSCGAKVASGNGKVISSLTEIETDVAQVATTANDVVTLA